MRQGSRHIEERHFMEALAETKSFASLQTLPGDDIRQLLWRFADRYELQMLVQAARNVARGPVARLVAQGGRNSHEWTPEKAALLPHFDESGITAAFLDPEQGGFIAGPKNLAPGVDCVRTGLGGRWGRNVQPSGQSRPFTHS
jgi:hypothetical protein